MQHVRSAARHAWQKLTEPQRTPSFLVIRHATGQNRQLSQQPLDRVIVQEGLHKALV